MSVPDDLAEVRRELSRRIAEWRALPATRSVLLVGGPDHGRLHAVRPESPGIPTVDGVGNWPPVLDVTHYRPAQIGSRDGGTATVFEVWVHDSESVNVGLGAVADAALRALAAAGLVYSVQHHLGPLPPRRLR